MRDQYTATCGKFGQYITNGFGHLGGSTAEIIVEAIRDIELTPRPPATDEEDEPAQSCKPDTSQFCSNISSLADASGRGCLDRVRGLLKDQGLDSQNNGKSEALTRAVRSGNDAVVQVLIDAGAPVNPVNAGQWTPLFEAAHWRKLGVLRILIAAGANVDARDNHGATYLASYGFFDERVTKILLESGANPNAMDDQGNTALMGASGFGYEGAIKLLLEYHADVNLKDVRARTAIMHAAAGRYVDAIPLLLEHGADLYARDRDGKTALDIARESKNEVAVELLSAAMEKAQPANPRPRH